MKNRSLLNHRLGDAVKTGRSPVLLAERTSQVDDFALAIFERLVRVGFPEAGFHQHRCLGLFRGGDGVLQTIQNPPPARLGPRGRT